jgi:hypothetical protein
VESTPAEFPSLATVDPADTGQGLYHSFGRTPISILRLHDELILQIGVAGDRQMDARSAPCCAP